MVSSSLNEFSIKFTVFLISLDQKLEAITRQISVSMNVSVNVRVGARVGVAWLSISCRCGCN